MPSREPAAGGASGRSARPSSPSAPPQPQRAPARRRARESGRNGWRGARPTGSHTAARLWDQMDLKLLEKTLSDRGEPRFRARQIWDWVARGAGSYDEMTNLPAELRREL